MHIWVQRNHWIFFLFQPLHLLCLLNSYTNKPLADATACEWGFFFLIGKHLHQTCALKSTKIVLWFLSLLIKHAWCFSPSCWDAGGRCIEPPSEAWRMRVVLRRSAGVTCLEESRCLLSYQKQPPLVWFIIWGLAMSYLSHNTSDNWIKCKKQKINK